MTRTLFLMSTVLLISACGGDGDGESATTQDDSANASPIAVITLSNASPVEGEAVTFDASGSSDPDSDTISFLWRQVTGPDMEFDERAPSITIMPEVMADTRFGFELTVTDGRKDAFANTAIDIANTLTLPRANTQFTGAFARSDIDANVPARHIMAFTDRAERFAILYGNEGDSLALREVERTGSTMTVPGGDPLYDLAPDAEIEISSTQLIVTEPSSNRISVYVRNGVNRFIRDSELTLSGVAATLGVSRPGRQRIVVASTNGGLLEVDAATGANPAANISDQAYIALHPWARARMGAAATGLAATPEFYAVAQGGEAVDIFGTSDDRILRVDSLSIAGLTGLDFVASAIIGTDVVLLHTDVEPGAGVTRRGRNVATFATWDIEAGDWQSAQREWIGPRPARIGAEQSFGERVTLFLPESGPEGYAVTSGSAAGLTAIPDSTDVGGFIEFGLGASDIAGGPSISSGSFVVTYPERDALGLFTR